MDRKDLKIQALLEKISNMTATYENQVADLRVDLTVTTQELDQANARVSELEAQNADAEEEAAPSDDSN